MVSVNYKVTVDYSYYNIQYNSMSWKLGFDLFLAHGSSGGRLLSTRTVLSLWLQYLYVRYKYGVLVLQ